MIIVMLILFARRSFDSVIITRAAFGHSARVFVLNDFYCTDAVSSENFRYRKTRTAKLIFFNYSDFAF